MMSKVEPNVVEVDGKQINKIVAYGRFYSSKTKKGFKKSIRKYNRDILLRMIKTYVRNSKDTYFLKEEIAQMFRADIALVEWCFHKLNLEGILEQPTHRAAHDCKRDLMSWGMDSSWILSQYFKTQKEIGRLKHNENNVG